MDDACVIEGTSVMKQAWKFDVDVIAKPAKDGDPEDKVQWSLDSDLKSGDELKFNKNDHNGMKKRDYFLIRFNLKDETDLDLRFAPNPSVAFWVNWNSEDCPEDACYSDQVYAVSVNQEDGDRLTVRNEDDSVAKFAFSLGFLKGGFEPSNPNGYIRFDPIGSNQNGGSN